MNRSQNFTEGKIFSQLVSFALPILLALFLQTMYGAVDLLIVGQFAAASDVSGVATGSQFMHTVTVVITGLAMGLTVLVGRKIGEGKPKEAGRIIGSGIFLFTVLAVILAAVVIILAPNLSQLLHAPKEAFDETVSYIRICSAGTIFIVAYNLVGSIFRGLGDSKIPLLTVAIACILNILGDLLLVAVFDMGTAGAAIATVFAQAMSVLLSLIVIRKRELPFTFSAKDLIPDIKLIKKILFLGTPIALQDLLVSISFLVILAIVNSLGLIASAGVGVAEKLCMFIMLVPSSYMQAMSAFVAQNIGAGKPERARKALLCGIASSFAVGALMFYLGFFHGDALSSLFAKDTEVIMASFEYLKAYAIDCLFVAFLFCFIGYFNGCGKTLFVMIQGIIAAFGVRIPISWIMSKQAGATLFHIGLATPSATVVQIILCGIYFFIVKREQDKVYKLK